MKDSSRRFVTRWIWILVMAPMALLLVLLLGVAVFARIPSFDELEHPDSKLATLVIAEDGEILNSFHIENRTFVPYESISPYAVQAAVSTEDERFYKHSGIDFKSFFRVFVKTLLLHDSSQGGGSTITQQLAKTLYPRQEDPSKVELVFIKMREWITAVKIERNYTKDEIVDMYLNSIFFGSGAYGIKAASQTFFAKDPANLTVEESAMLIGMVNKPTRYNPVINPDKALSRRNFVIGKMARSGYITKAERDSICQLPINVSRYQVQDHNAGLAPYFRDMIRRDMQAREPKRSSYRCEEEYQAAVLRWKEDPIYGWIQKNKKSNGEKYNIDRDGLRIYTTVNYRMQQYAEAAMREHLARHQKAFDAEMRGRSSRPFAPGTEQSVINGIMQRARKNSDRYRMKHKSGMADAEIFAQFSQPVRMRIFAWNRKGFCDTTMTPDDSIRYYKGMLRAGFVAMEPNTGYVKAYVGGPEYRYMKFDNVSQCSRQIGSTIKPFIYTLAMDSGLSPCDKVVDMPQTFLMPDGTEWTPRSSGGDGDIVTLAWGLSRSSNNVSAFLMKQFGPDQLVSTMRQMGICAPLDPVYSLCVGSAEVELYDMVASYNIFPSGGTYIYPQYVTRIEDNQGNIIADFTSRRRTALSANTAFRMIQMMGRVVDEGTGHRLRNAPYSLVGAMAGKTGTTNNNSDAWFIGYTPSIVAGAWCGCEDMQAHFISTANGQGASAALPIWGRFMRKCMDDPLTGISPNDEFIAPAGYEGFPDCEVSGEFLGGAEDELRQTAEEQEEDYYFN